MTREAPCLGTLNAQGRAGRAGGGQIGPGRAVARDPPRPPVPATRPCPSMPRGPPRPGPARLGAARSGAARPAPDRSGPRGPSRRSAPQCSPRPAGAHRSLSQQPHPSRPVGDRQGGWPPAEHAEETSLRARARNQFANHHLAPRPAQFAKPPTSRAPLNHPGLPTPSPRTPPTGRQLPSPPGVPGRSTAHLTHRPSAATPFPACPDSRPRTHHHSASC